MHKNTLCALIGLAGAVNNNGKTDRTDAIVHQALLSPDTVDLTEQIHEEKYRVSPNCATCASPCGNTSDYPAEAIDHWTETSRQLREQILQELYRIAAKGKADDALPEIIWKAIGYLGYDLKNEAYQTLLEDMKKW